eukprot:jgi/Tetstr1/464397/TSEL_009190.t1
MLDQEGHHGDWWQLDQEAMARILNRTEKIDKVWTFVRENFNEQREGSEGIEQPIRDYNIIVINASTMRRPRAAAAAHQQQSARESRTA